MVLHNIQYLNDPSKAEQAQPGSRLVLSSSRLREMNLYLEIVRDTSINPVKQIGDLPARQCHSGGASLFHRANMVSTPKYHPLPACSRPTEGLAGFFLPSAGSRTGIEGEKVLPGSYISNSYCRPYLPALPFDLSANSRERRLWVREAGEQVCLKPCFQELLSLDGRGIKGEGDLFSAVSSQQKRRELTQVLVRLNLTHIRQLWYKNGIQVRIIVMSRFFTFFQIGMCNHHQGVFYHS